MNNQQIPERDDLHIINLQDDLEEEDDNDSLVFHFCNEIIKINFHQFCKYCHIVQDEIKNETSIHNIIKSIELETQRYHIKIENMQIFFKLLKDEKIEIKSDQYRDLCVLSEIFKVNSLKRSLKIYAQKFSQNINFIINLLLEQQSDETDELFPNDYISEDIEECLISNVNKCLTNELFGKLNISTIYRIIEKSDQKQIESDLLYSFIIKSIDERYCLFTFLDIKKINDENFDDLINHYQQNNSLKYFEYIPNDLAYIKQFKEEKQRQEENIEQLTQIKGQLEHKIDTLTSANDQFQNQVNQLRSHNQQLENTINKIQEENKQLLEIQNQIKTENNKLQISVNEERDQKDQFKKLYDQQIQENKDILKNNEELKSFESFIDNFQNLSEIKKSKILHKYL